MRLGLSFDLPWCLLTKYGSIPIVLSIVGGPCAAGFSLRVLFRARGASEDQCSKWSILFGSYLDLSASSRAHRAPFLRCVCRFLSLVTALLHHRASLCFLCAVRVHGTARDWSSCHHFKLRFYLDARQRIASPSDFSSTSGPVPNSQLESMDTSTFLPCVYATGEQ